MSKLAIAGGTPLYKAASPNVWPIFGKEEEEALKRVIDSQAWGTIGPEAVKFSKNFSEYLGCAYGISTTNGTLSLEHALRALGIGYGDEVIVPTYTFYSTMSCVAMVGAYPVLADTEPNGFNIDPEDVRAKITDKARAVIVTHLGGSIGDMNALLSICREKGLYLVEDCAHAHGSVWNGKKAGAIGDVGCFSFQGSKNLTGGEGGFISTDNKDIYAEAWRYHHSGRALEGASDLVGKIALGGNARMSEWPAAILNVQLTRLDEQIANRMDNAAYLKEQLAKFDFLIFPKENELQTANSLHLLPVIYDKSKFHGISKSVLSKAIAAEGSLLTCGYNAVFDMRAFRTPNFEKSTGRTFSYTGLANTRKLCEESGMWFASSFQLLGDHAKMDKIVSVIEKVAANYKELEHIN